MPDHVGSQWSATEIEDAAARHLLSPAEDMTRLGAGLRPLLSYGEGIYVVDAHGRRLIDGPAGMWCTQVGYGRREIVDGIASQAMRLTYNSPWYFVNGPAATLARRIARLTPGDLDHVFFTTGGSTAVDTALRFVEFYNNVQDRPAKKVVLCRLDGYHGSTALAAACSGRTGNWPNFDIASDRISFLSSPNPRLRGARSEDAFLDLLVAEFEQRVATLGPERVGAFLAEPLLASGGVIVPPAGYHARIKALCERHDILYISDEVVTAFGRCGHWFASEAMFGVVPDIITFAKGVTSGYVPLGGLAISDRVLERVSGANARDSFFTNGYTYSGHPVSCAAALANLDVIERDGLLDHVREIGPYFQERLRSLESLPFVADVRGVGLVGCVECLADPGATQAAPLDRRIGARIDRHCFERGLIVRPIGHMCVLSPPLVITREEIDALVAILRASILQTWADFEAGELAEAC